MGRISKEQIQERERLAKSGLKRCSVGSGCGLVKSVDDFGAHKGQWDKKSTLCRMCARKNDNQYRKKNPEVKKASARRSYLNNLEARREYYAKRSQADPMHYRLESGKARAKKAGAEWENISFTDLLSHWELRGITIDTCYYCKQTVNIDDLQLDHGIPVIKGGSHTVDNLYPAHKSCNLSKKDRTVEEYMSDLKQVSQ